MGCFEVYLEIVNLKATFTIVEAAAFTISLCPGVTLTTIPCLRFCSIVLGFGCIPIDLAVRVLLALPP